MKQLCSVIIILLLLVASACSSNTNEGGNANASKSSQQKAAKVKVSVPEFNADSAYQYIQKQVDFGPRVPGTKAHKACADWLEQTFKSFNTAVTVQTDKVKAHTGEMLPMYNVIASINPTQKTRILLGAHWDTRPNADQDSDENKVDEPIIGANDGGSGVGVLLEIARIMAANPANIGVDIILFDVEDYGDYGTSNSFCLGSQYWSRKKHIENYSAKYGILIDMVGSADATFLQEIYSLQYAAPIVKKVWNAAHSLGFGPYFKNTRTRTAITDDHYFVNTLANIPMIDIIHYTPQGNFGHFWHTHNDDMKIIDKGTLKAVGQTVLHVIYHEAAQGAS